MEVYKDMSFTATNVVRFMGTVPNSELGDVIERMTSHIESNGARRLGKLITITHVLYLETKVSDMEIFMPIDRVIPTTQDFTFMPKFELVNCMMTKHKGHPCLLPVTYTKLYRAIENFGLKAEPPFYNVFDEWENGIWDLDECEVEVYVAVKLLLKSQLH